VSSSAVNRVPLILMKPFVFRGGGAANDSVLGSTMD